MDSRGVLASIDWYREAADPSAYVGRPLADQALAEIEAAVVSRHSPMLLLGAAGVGKTLALRVLAKRLEDRMQPIYLPVSTLPQSEICALALGLAGGESMSFPESDLLACALEQRDRGCPVVLLIDDAGSMTSTAARGIAAIAAASHGGLRLIFGVTDGPDALRIALAAGPDLGAICLMEPMSAIETRDYIRQRITRALGLTAAVGLDHDLLDHIHRESGGVPGRVNQLSSMFPTVIQELVETHAF